MIVDSLNHFINPIKTLGVNGASPTSSCQPTEPCSFPLSVPSLLFSRSVKGCLTSAAIHYCASTQPFCKVLPIHNCISPEDRTPSYWRGHKEFNSKGKLHFINPINWAHTFKIETKTVVVKSNFCIFQSTFYFFIFVFQKRAFHFRSAKCPLFKIQYFLIYISLLFFINLPFNNWLKENNFIKDYANTNMAFMLCQQSLLYY